MLKKLCMSLGGVIFVSVIICFLLVDSQLKQPLNIYTSQLLTIKSGMSFNTFTKKLVTDSWIDNNFWLKVYTKLNTNLSKIKVGTYLIEKDTNTLELLEQVVAGKEHQFTITFIEGSTFKQWLRQLNEMDNIVHTLKQSSVVEIAKKLNINQTNPEGLFYPDTYAFTVGTSDLELLKRAQQKMLVELSKVWEERANPLPYNNKYQALIMASIIEKESGKNVEHGIISSVFINRLNKGMRLQTDPTIIYGLGERYKGDIKREHKREKTAYNTYRIDGLPPTPIAMPGKSAIYAALNPLATDYYYFVSDGHGQHVFSKTLVEHNRAVRRYLKEMRNLSTNTPKEKN